MSLGGRLVTSAGDGVLQIGSKAENVAFIDFDAIVLYSGASGGPRKIRNRNAMSSSQLAEQTARGIAFRAGRVTRQNQQLTLMVHASSQTLSRSSTDRSPSAIWAFTSGSFSTLLSSNSLCPLSDRHQREHPRLRKREPSVECLLVATPLSLPRPASEIRARIIVLLATPRPCTTRGASVGGCMSNVDERVGRLPPSPRWEDRALHLES